MKNNIYNLNFFVCLSLYIKINDVSRRLDHVFYFVTFPSKKSSTPSVLVIVCLAGWGRWVDVVWMCGVRELEGG